MKLLILALLAAIVPLAAQAQVANISTSSLDNLNGFNLTSGASNGSSTVYFSNDGNTVLGLVNNSTTAVTATIVTQATAVNVTGFGLVSLTNNVITLPASAKTILGPFPKARWNVNTYDTVGVSLTAPTYTSVSAIRIPQ